VIDLNFDQKSTSTSPIGEARGVNLPTLFAHETKPKWLEFITLIVFYPLITTNVEPNDPILVCFKPNIMVFE
jgi:hypothetical protein